MSKNFIPVEKPPLNSLLKSFLKETKKGRYWNSTERKFSRDFVSNRLLDLVNHIDLNDYSKFSKDKRLIRTHKLQLKEFKELKSKQSYSGTFGRNFFLLIFDELKKKFQNEKESNFLSDFYAFVESREKKEKRELIGNPKKRSRENVEIRQPPNKKRKIQKNGNTNPSFAVTAINKDVSIIDQTKSKVKNITEEKAKEKSFPVLKPPRLYSSSEVRFKVVKSIGPFKTEKEKLDAFKDLCAAKNVYGHMLPNMPKDYISRLVFDTTHVSLLGYIHLEKENRDEIMCGITYKPFFQQGYVEIAFVAVHTKFQLKGMGSVMMNNFKKHLQEVHCYRMITCADNHAVGYFKKQGFSTTVYIDKKRYLDHIKSYERVTLMECVIRPDIDYINFRKIVPFQQKMLVQRIEYLNPPILDDEIYQGIPFFKELKRKKINDREKIKVLSISEKIPGLEFVKKKSYDTKKERDNVHKKMKATIDAVVKCKDAWPFKIAVSKKEAPDYHSIISHPMDLSRMKRQLERRAYDDDLKLFHHDMLLIFRNCRVYNAPNTLYYKCADDTEKFYYKQLVTRGLLDYL